MLDDGARPGGLGPDGAGPGGLVVAAVERLGALVTEIAGLPIEELVEPQASAVHATLRRAQDALGLVTARVLARIEADGRWATTPTGKGSRDFEEYLAKASRGTRSGARRQTRLARTVTDDAVPGLARALTGGGVSLEHADVLTRLGPTSPARRAALTSEDPRRNAGFLLGKAAEQSVEQFTTEVKRWAATVDPTADERGHRAATERVTCTLSPRDDGVALTAFLTTIDGACFDAALTAVAGIPAADDTRTHGQRMGAALGDMARLILDHGLAAERSGGFRPHLTVTVPYDTLTAHVEAATATPPAAGQPRNADTGGADPSSAQSASADAGGRGDQAYPVIPPGWDPATLADGTPIPATVLARLACDGEITRVIFGPASQVLDVGRAERLYTGAMRRAVIARDRHCTYPTCTRPPTFGEIHHIRHWAAHNGETSIANGVLLCWHHHAHVHTHHLTIRRNHARARWDFHERDGTPIPHPEAVSDERPGMSRRSDPKPAREPDRPDPGRALPTPHPEHRPEPEPDPEPEQGPDTLFDVA